MWAAILNTNLYIYIVTNAEFNNGQNIRRANCKTTMRRVEPRTRQYIFLYFLSQITPYQHFLMSLVCGPCHALWDAVLAHTMRLPY